MKPVEVESFAKTCNCLSVDPESFILEAGEKRELRLTINLLKQTTSTGEISVDLFPKLKTGRGEPAFGPRWTVRGKVRRAVVFQRSIDLGRHSELARSLPPWEIPLEVLAPLESIAAKCDVPGIIASVQFVQEDRNKPTLRLIATTSLPTGELKGIVSLRPILKGGELLPLQTMRIFGKIVRDLEAQPPAVLVGGRRLGEEFEEEIVLRTQSGQTLVNLQFKVEGELLSVETLEENRRYRVRQKACAVGFQANCVRFLGDLAGRPVSVTLPVEYTGVKAK